MIKVPPGLWEKYNALLGARGVPRAEHADYRKWIRFYLGFCHKYQFAYGAVESLPPFLEKLESKSQTEAQRRQATEAVRLYYRMLSDSQKRKTDEDARRAVFLCPMGCR